MSTSSCERRGHSHPAVRSRPDVGGGPPRPAAAPPNGADAAARDALAAEQARIRGWLHDSTVQTLEYLAGGGFGESASAEEMMHLAARAGAELREQLERLGAPESSDLVEA